MSTSAVGAVVSVVLNSTTCQQCNPGEGEAPARRTLNHFLVLWVRVLRPDLDRFVARDELYKTHGLHSHVVDGRRLQVVRGVRLRKTEAFSQIMAT